VESKNEGTPEQVQAFDSRLQAAEKSIEEMKSGKDGLETLRQSIATILTQVCTLAWNTRESVSLITTNNLPIWNNKLYVIL
jgi:hypothetical protein